MKNHNENMPKTDINDYLSEMENNVLSDYQNFKLHILAQKIKTASYKPKPKMLYL